MSHMIEFDRVTKLYGTVLGANDINLTLEPGAYGLLGPNGSGKTTLLNLLVGQLTPTLGTVKVLGMNPRNSAELHSRLAYCPSSEGLYAKVSGFQWVSYLVELHGYSRTEAKERAEHWLTVTGMKDAMHRHIAGYSRGMRQRTKLSQALAHDSELIILDEPFSGLDPVGRHEMTQLLRERVDQGTSVLFASHVLHEIESLTSSFLLIRDGRVLASGSKEEIYDLLVDIPTEVNIHCDDLRALAAFLMRDESTRDSRVEGDSLRVSTTSAARLYEILPSFVRETGISIRRIESASASLHELFTSLMKIHRGEV